MSELHDNARQALCDISLLNSDDLLSNQNDLKNYLHQILNSDRRYEQLLGTREDATSLLAQGLALNRLNYETILHLFQKLQNLMQNRKYDPEYDFPAAQLYKTKSLALTKAILLVSYRYNLGAQEIGELCYSWSDVHWGNPRFHTKSKCAERPLRDLEAPYYEALDTWGRLLKYEDSHSIYYFGQVLAGNNVIAAPLGIKSYQRLVVNYLL